MGITHEIIDTSRYLAEHAVTPDLVATVLLRSPRDEDRPHRPRHQGAEASRQAVRPARCGCPRPDAPGPAVWPQAVRAAQALSRLSAPPAPSARRLRGAHARGGARQGANLAGGHRPWADPAERIEAERRAQ